MTTETSQAGGNTTATASAPPAASAAAPAAGAPASAPAAAASAASSQQATEGQAAAQAAAATNGDAGKATTEGAKAPDTAAAPVKYELKAPEGVHTDPEVLTAYSEVAKEAGLSPEVAQKVLDTLAPKMAAQSAKALSLAVQKTATEWAKATQADPEIGGEKFGENLAVAKRGLERFASPELRALLGAYHPESNPKGTGLGNHPELVRLFTKVGKAISEDKFVNGERQPTAGDKDLATRLYPQPNAR